MKKLMFGSATLVACLVAAGSAMAADMVVKAPIVAPYSWAGPYLGGNVGYGWASDPATLTDSVVTTVTLVTDVTSTPVFHTPTQTAITAAGSGNVNPNGVIGGVQGGYNWQSGTIVFGLEGDIEASGQNGSTTLCDTAGCPVGSGIATAGYKLPWFGTLRARLGFTPQPRWLIYATGGLAVAEIDESVSEGPVGGTPGIVINSNTTRAGFAVGGGVETAITDRWSIKAEYLFMGFGNVGVTGAGVPVTTTVFPNVRTEIITSTTMIAGLSTRISDNIVRVGLNYHF
jgi:outer membrane immunogenic protein